MARGVAAELGGYYINTGEMYRMLTWYVLAKGIDADSDVDGIIRVLDDIDITCEADDQERVQMLLQGKPVPQPAVRSPAVTLRVSCVARIPEVRRWMVARQQEMASLPLIVMEGRDIGTVVFPSARHKFFITASPEERARRRLAQVGETVDGATLSTVAAEIAERDRIDSTREVSPLKPAADAVTINTSEITETAAVEALTVIVRERWADGSA